MAEGLAEAVALRFEVLEAEAASPHTLAKYRLYLGRYLAWVSERLDGKPPTVAALNASNVRRFQEWLRTVHTSPRVGGTRVGHSVSSEADHVVILRAFGSFLVDQRILRANPLQSVKPPKVPKKELPIFTKQQALLMLDLCSQTHYPHRNRAVLSMLLDTGIRISELLNAELADYTPWSVKRKGRIKVMGKGLLERYLPVARSLGMAISKYLRFERPDDRGRWLFLAQDGDRLTRNAVDTMIKWVGKRAGVRGVRLSAHTCRHTWATNAIAKGKAFHVQAMLGHSSLAMTQRYVRMAEALKASDMDSVLDGWEDEER